MSRWPTPRRHSPRGCGRIDRVQGWLFYARTEATLGNWAIAADAFQHALALGQTSADVQSAYGEMQVLAADGIVGPPARTAFIAALHRDKTDLVARYYLALADAQAGESLLRDRRLAGRRRRPARGITHA